MAPNVRQTFWKAFAANPVVMIRLEGDASRGAPHGHTHCEAHSEPMTALLDRDAHHAVWFVCRRDNRIGKGGRATAQVMTLGHEVFASLSGTLVEETDPAARSRHWSQVAEDWFPHGHDDPAVTMLRFEIEDAEVWTLDAGIKGLFRLATGGTIDPARIGEHETGVV